MAGFVRRLRFISEGADEMLIGGVALLAIIFVAISVYISSKKKQTAVWPATRGRVIGSAVERVRDADGEWSMEPRITYEYTVNGQVFRGTRVKFGFTPKAQPTVARYPVGQEVEVFYDPAKPGEAVLERGKVTAAG